MRRLLILPLLFLLALPPLLAEAPTSELYDYDRMTLKLSLANQLTLLPKGGTYSVDEVSAELTWYPRPSYRQLVEEVVTRPRAHEQEDAYQYVWISPRERRLDFGLTALLRTTNEPLSVTRKSPFPISSLPAEMAWYTEEAELIDLDADIEEQALLLAGGKDDLFEVVYTIADWVTSNIAYNLTTVTASASKPSTWVMANRQGVCDEMTSLFISMLRSLGIPARFVSGVSYTNLPEFAEPWGGHGWAEVWFPDTGWVPFDVTYGTYGYVDATHIKLKESLDAGGSSVDFTMRGRGADLITQSLDMDVEILDKQRVEQEHFSVILEAFDDVGLDSYNLVTASVRNNEQRYISARLQLARTENVEIVGEPRRTILLRPGETIQLRWLLRTKELSRGFRYEFPLKLYAGLREAAATSFQAREGLPTYTRAFFDSYLDVDAEKPYNEFAQLTCAPAVEAAYVGEQVAIDCFLTNEERVALSDVRLCISERCTAADVARGSEEAFSQTFACDAPGMKSHLATATNRELNAYALNHYQCLDEAAVTIRELEHPAALAFAESGEISFVVEKESDTLPERARIEILHDNFGQWWEAEALPAPQKFSYRISGQHLDLEGNEVTVRVTYQDALGKEYETSETFAVAPKDFSFWERVQVHLLNLSRWFDSQLA